MNRSTEVAVVIVWLLASARMVRLIVWDAYPPCAKLRAWWDGKVTSDWNKLLHCGYCAAPWITAVSGIITLALLRPSIHYSDPTAWFWLLGGWFAASYATAIIVAYDGDD